VRAWTHPTVPVVPGPGRGRPRVFDSRTGSIVTAGPATGDARLYACGITPYDATHLGHAFTYVAVDLLHRLWLDAGLGVRYAQNVTDVDDPLLERAEATGVDWQALAAEQVDLFRSDMTALRVIPPQDYVAVTDSVPRVAGLIESMLPTGTVYQVADPQYPDWYFAVTEAPGFLDHLGMDAVAAQALFAERGGDPERPGKRHPLDCLLWRLERPGEPAWESALGRGRPGWHIECVSIAVDSLGPTFDVQAGGSDLAFPHHPMCAAEAQVATGRPFAEVYLHAGMVGLDGEKMSKSRGNLVFVHRLLADGVDPMVIRLVLLDHHYRADWEFTADELKRAADRLASWRPALARPVAAPAAPFVQRLRAALRADLDAPAALAAVDAWANAPGYDPTAPGLMRAAVDALLGVTPG